MNKPKEFKIIELGEVIGSLAVKIGVQPFLLVFTRKSIALVWPRFKLVKSLVFGMSAGRFFEAKEAVKISKLSGKELHKKIDEWSKKGRLKMGGLIYLDKIVKATLKKGRLGGVKLEINMVDNKKIGLDLIYGVGTGIDRNEAIDLAEKLIKEAGLVLEKQL